jgi:enediyne polyketide synthase
MGLEAAAQAATALTGIDSVRELTGITLERPITVPENGARVVRVAAIARNANTVDVAVRSDETGFKVDHFRIVCRLGRPWRRRPAELPAPGAGLDPADVLYDRILFHRGRFRRVRRYHLLKAHTCVAEVDASAEADWFGAYLPDALVLGDPGARDAFLHAVQACIPHQRLLPTGVERIQLIRPPAGTVRVVARERARRGRILVYDLDVVDEDNRVCELWRGLALTAVGQTSTPSAWPPVLLAAYAEHRLEELLSGHVSVAVAHGHGRRARSDEALSRLRRGGAVLRRPDGKPADDDSVGLSATHVDGMTFALAGPAPVGIDAETVVARDEELWRDLLGTDGLVLAQVIRAESAEGLDRSAARVWVAHECLRKAGRSAAPLTANRRVHDGWAVLRAGELAIATYVGCLETLDAPVALGFLVGGEPR